MKITLIVGKNGVGKTRLLKSIQGLYISPMMLGIDATGEIWRNKIYDSLLLCKDQNLMIDDIEYGQHYSEYEDLWDKIFTEAERLNIDVYITTHSWDCIKWITPALDDHPTMTDVTIQRIGKRPAVFDRNEIKICVREELEVR